MNSRCMQATRSRRARAAALGLLTALLLAGGAGAAEPATPEQPAAAAPVVRPADAMPAIRSPAVDDGAAGAAAAPAAPAAASAAAPTALPAAPPAAESAAPAGAAATADAPGAAGKQAAELRSLDTRIQETKTDVIELNRDLLVLEEELLFPANTQVAIFVSMDVGKLFELDSVQVRLDNQEVAGYLYTPAEVAALHRGGVQRLYLGNLRAGPHELVAFFTGKGPHDRDYRRGATVKFDKSTDAKYIELQIKDSTGALQPEFAVKLWQ